MDHNWTALQGASYISLRTFRKNGAPVATPVWFAEQQGKLVIYTVANSGKVKRIRNNGRVEVAACDRRGVINGPVLTGMARLLSPAESAPAEQTLNRKYPLKRLFNVFARLRPTPRAYIEVSPA